MSFFVLSMVRYSNKTKSYHLFDITLVLLAVLCVSVMLLMPREVRMTMNGAEICSDAEAIWKNETLYLPIRIIAEEAGYDVHWDENRQAVIITSVHTEIEAKPDSNDYVKDKERQMLTELPFLVENRVYMRIDDIAKMLELSFIWDDENYMINLKVT